MHNVPRFRRELAIPYGSERGIFTEDHFANLAYATLLDATILTLPVCRAFTVTLGGAAAGKKVADSYSKILAASGQARVMAAPPGKPALLGAEASPTPVRVEHKKLPDLSAYLLGLPRQRAMSWMRGLSRGVGTCSALITAPGCHNVDQNKPVLRSIVPMKTIFTGDDPQVLLAHRTPPLNPILDTAEKIGDDKMAVITGSQRGQECGITLPVSRDRVHTGFFFTTAPYRLSTRRSIVRTIRERGIHSI